jgi:hypothetical protein
MSTTSSTNMSLPIPVVGQESGPQWATDLNNCMTIIDGHTHATGSGVPITPAALNINADLTFNSSYSITDLKKAVFTSQSAAITGTNFASVVGGNLYFNDGSGNQIPITSGGGVAGSPGSIGSLASPAAATYSAGSKLFTWTADSGKAAAMDNGAVTIRETNVASAKGITLASPTALSADYQFTLPGALPGSTQYLTCSSLGVLSFSSADTIAAAMTSTGANSIAATMTATGANAVAASRTRATGTTVSTGGVAISASSGAYASAATSVTAVTNLSVTITTSGRPVFVGLVADGDTSQSNAARLGTSGSGTFSGYAIIKRDSTIISYNVLPSNSTTSPLLPPSMLNAVDAVAAGTYTYTVSTISQNAALSVLVEYCKLVAYEL